MSTDKSMLSIKIDSTLYDALREAAKRDQRPMANYVRLKLQKAVDRELVAKAGSHEPESSE